MSRRLSRRFRWPGAPRCAPTVVPIGSARVLSETPPQRGQHVPRRGQRRTGLARRACRAAECVQRNRSTTALGQTISGDPTAGEFAARAGARRSPLGCQTLCRQAVVRRFLVARNWRCRKRLNCYASWVRAARKCRVLIGVLVALSFGSESCSDGRCGTRRLSENPYCGSDCQRLEELSKGCLGSHTEQNCTAHRGTYIRVGGDDASTPFYNARGEMVAIQIIAEGEDSCRDAWFGIDLSECVPTGAVRQVVCDPQVE
jgi:hypothetical protein